MTDKLKNLIDNLKHAPGVYLMHDKDDAIIYVGKAKDLYKRVSQYFYRPQAGKVFKMVTNVDYFETIITENEKEAFILEMNLIQKYYPRYNILLKDGSHYPYIALKRKGVPYLTIKRNDKDKNYDYFGPFPNSSAAYEMINLINKIYPTRKCLNVPNSSCLYYHLGTCLAPCVNKIDEKISEQYKNEIKAFLNGNNQKEKAMIKEKMLQASENMEYELANDYKNILLSIEHINTTQNVEIKDKIDRDILAYSTRNGYIALVVFLYRKGLLLGKKVFTVEQFNEENEQISELILQFYQSNPLPKEIIINDKEIIDNIKPILNVECLSVSKGHLYDLLIVAKENANNALDEYFLSAKIDEDKLSLLEELSRLINIDVPIHIELFDNSHLQGSYPVGVAVSFINGEPIKKLYRKFKIEHSEARDDIKSMQEVIYRHYNRKKIEESKLPDLILVDGGYNQIKAAHLSLMALGLSIPIFGLYKNDKHQTSGLMGIDEKTYPINNKNLFFLLTRMQDEVHRFAISYHISKRDKAMKSSLLDDVKGLGNKRKEILLRSYPDIEELKNASLRDLEQLLPKDIALNIYKLFH